MAWALFLIPMATTAWLKFRYRQLDLMLITLIAVGVTQGLCSNIAFFTGQDDVNWGGIKGALLAFLFLTTVFNFKSWNRRLSPPLLIWLGIYIVFFYIIVFHVFEVVNDGKTISMFNVLQNFSIVNMLMVLISYLSYEKKSASAVVDLLITLGKLVSVIAILQWILFKYYEIDTSLLMAAKGFGSLNSDDGEALRVFSVFYTHYGLSAFLTLVTILYVSRSLFRPSEFSFSLLGLFFIAHSLTFNLTGLFLTVGGCLFSLCLYKRNNKFRISRSTAMRITAFFFIGLSLALLNPTFQQRVQGIADYSDTSSGAGNSLYQRNMFIGNAIDLLASNPDGLGLSLTDTSSNEYEDLGYVRTGILEQPISADAWFLWLILQIGLFFGSLILLIYAVPFLVGVFSPNVQDLDCRWQICAFTSVVFVILLGALSNSTILNYPPSNIIFWWMVGALLAMSGKSRKLITQVK